jgi:hypothetical protein
MTAETLPACLLAHVLAQRSAHGANVFGRRGLRCPDRPGGLIRHDDSAEQSVTTRAGDGVIELADARARRIRRVGMTCLTEAQDRSQAVAQRGSRLGSHHAVVLAEQPATFGVAHLDHAAADLGDPRPAHLACERPSVFRAEILRTDCDPVAENFVRCGHREIAGNDEQLRVTVNHRPMVARDLRHRPAPFDGARVAEIHLQAHPDDVSLNGGGHHVQMPS